MNKNIHAAISADVVSSSSIPREEWIELVAKIKELLLILEKRYSGFWGRVVKGDSIECILNCPNDAFEVAIIIKAFVKAFSPENATKQSKISKFGVRIAIGVGEMKTIDRTLDIMDGDAIYRSGRSLNNWTGWSKYAFVVSMSNGNKQKVCQLMMSLINHNINAATPRQCETLYHQLMEGNEKLVAEKMGIKFQGVYKNLGTIGWSHIDDVLQYIKSIKF